MIRRVSFTEPRIAEVWFTRTDEQSVLSPLPRGTGNEETAPNDTGITFGMPHQSNGLRPKIKRSPVELQRRHIPTGLPFLTWVVLLAILAASHTQSSENFSHRHARPEGDIHSPVDNWVGHLQEDYSSRVRRHQNSERWHIAYMQSLLQGDSLLH